MSRKPSEPQTYRELVAAALDQPRPSAELVAALNRHLAATGHELRLR